MPTQVQSAASAGPIKGNYSATGASGLKEAISYDAASGLYTFYSTDSSSTPLSLTSDAMVAGAVPGYSYFKVSDPRSPGAKDLIVVYNSASNPLTLTYTSFAFAQMDPSLKTSVQQAYVFGVQTSNLPTTGSASYSGLVAGSAQDSAGQLYVLNGTSTLTADFAKGAYSTTLSFTGVDANGRAGLGTQNYAGSAGSFTLNGSPLNGNLSGSGTGSWGGKFFGPNAEEFGYTFAVSGSNYNAVGVAAGKKN
ncbi:hypothetical protein [Sphingomonas trueperi]|uniref:hypothetical protein n=1 Tax=Sphingomonas trueperi TaxID=53317 RepID=UPI000EB3FE91